VTVTYLPAVGQAAEREDVDDVGMADLVDGARLLQEPLDGRGIVRQRRLQHLDRGALADHRVSRGVHDAHAAAAELAVDRVATDVRTELDAAIEIVDDGPTIGLRVVLLHHHTYDCKPSSERPEEREERFPVLRGRVAERVARGLRLAAVP
jgi:hypothetical protein